MEETKPHLDSEIVPWKIVEIERQDLKKRKKKAIHLYLTVLDKVQGFLK